MVMPATQVAAPTRVPTPFGLFSTVTFRPPSAAVARWSGSGIEFDTPGCSGPLQGIGYSADFCADPDTVAGLPRTFTRSPGAGGEATPFAVVGAHQCSPVGNDVAAARALAEQRLTSGEERAVEHAFSTGLLGNTPNLRGATELTAVAVPFNVGIGLLEEWLSVEYGAQGVIHAPRLIVAGTPGAVKASGQTLRTVLGTPVAAGSGYDGSSPDGTPATGAARWVYATPAITGYRGDITVSDLFDMKVNDQVAYAERDYLLAFEDCGVAAVLVEAGASGLAEAASITLPTRPGNPYLITP